MKPFDLEKALAGEPVVTRDGLPVTNLHLINENVPYPLVGILNDRLQTWTKDGRFTAIYETCNDDLLMAPKEHKEYIVRSGKYGTVSCLMGPFKTIEMANTFAQIEGGTVHEITVIE